MIFCAYNGFSFDFRLIVYHLNLYGMSIDPYTYFIDPFLDMRKFDRRTLTLDVAFKMIKPKA